MCLCVFVLSGGRRTNTNSYFFSFPCGQVGFEEADGGWGSKVGALVFKFQLKPPATTSVHC